MLFVSFLMLIIGFSLVYAGLHGGDTWKQPWKPFVDQLSRKTTPA